MVETRSGIDISPYTKEQQEKMAALVKENKERKELLKQEKLKAIAEEQAAKMKKLEEEMKRVQHVEEERRKAVEEAAAAEEEKERMRIESREGSSGTKKDTDAEMEKKISEWVANLSLGEDEEAESYVTQDERDALASELAAMKDPMERREREEEQKLALLKKEAISQWDKDCTTARKRLKRALIEYPVLKVADPSLPFVVTTDASQYGIGAVLQQDDGNGYRPIEFMSARMPSEKVATSTYERELYALRQALEHWKHYLLGGHFKMYSDHETLRWLKTQAKMTPKLTRWAAEIDQYDFELKPAKGKYNVVADALSVVEREVVHAIEIVSGSKVPRGRIYRMSPAELDELRRQLKELTEKGWIWPSTSPYGAPVLFVPKKGGPLRMCIDYRGLNAIIVKNAEPLPRIDDLLDRVQGCRYFTKIDLKSGYHQIAVRPEDQHKTTFRTRYGLYEFVVMPFGLCNAPGTFHHAMDRIFHDYLDKFIVVYLDDILIFSRTVEEYAEHLKTVLGLLRQHRYKVNLDKCEFGRTKILYLGHEISADGLRPEDAKVASIRDWLRPQTVTEVKSFWGMTGYYCPFVKNFSTIASPLTDLTRLHTAWEWTEECEASFKKLKYALTHYEVLKLPDPDKPFVVTTDASQYGISAVLVQKEGPKLRPIEYMSKKMPSQKLAKSTYERELYALYRALDCPIDVTIGPYETYEDGLFSYKLQHDLNHNVKTLAAAVKIADSQLQQMDTHIATLEARPSQAAPGCTTDTAKQLGERIDHVVNLIGELGDFTSPATISSTVAAIKTDITKLQTRPDAATKTYKMPHFNISKFDDYNKTDALTWWQSFPTKASCRTVPTEDMMKALYLQLIGGAQAWMNHFAANKRDGTCDLKT
ncbi:hypothetical protein CBR_g49122 [Chara braunii]|uniref:Reverse transcriptase domain-containing protein n=1 Tax=Chara braunii TaxID=69332 RepID=A0A388K4R8_CHABU|nr:hypothetical protein CBR_g49122 [Chara braunii]|eukprot:GBG65052.1 hypothetical protein CBR_g49122 [Chara braunii]